MKTIEFCECNQYCLKSKCVSSDSGLQVRKCWCAECKEVRKEIKAQTKPFIDFAKYDAMKAGA